MPTLVANYPVSSGTTSASTALVTPSFTPSAGEIIVVKTMCGSTVVPTPSGGGLTYTSRATNSNFPRVDIFTAVVGASPGSMTVSVAWSATSRRGIVVERWSLAALAATPATNATKTGSGAPSATLVTTADDSAVTWLCGDNNETTGTVTYRSSATGEQNQLATGTYSGRWAYQTAAVAGTQTFGMTAPTGQSWSMVGIEILDNSALPTDLTDPASGQTGVSSAGGDTVEALTNIITLTDSVSGQAGVGLPGDDTIGVALTDPTTGQAISQGAGGELVAVSIDDQAAAPIGVSSPGGDQVVSGELLLPDAGRVAVAFFVVDRATNALTPIPHQVGFELSPIRNSPGAVQVEYPKRGLAADLLWPLVDDDTQVEVEIWIGNRSQNAMRAILTEGSADDVAETALGTFTGQFLECLLDGIQLRYNSGNAKGETVFSAVSPGSFAKHLLDLAAARGTLTDAAAITYGSFTATHDSAGNLWPETITGTFSPGQSLLTLFQAMADDAVFEFEITAARDLRLYVFGSRGVDRTTGNTPTVLRRGLNVLQASRKRTSRDAVTDLEVYGKDNLHDTAVSLSARSRYGRRIEGAASAGEIDQQAALDAYAEKELQLSSQGKLEITCGLLYGVGAPTPVNGFNIGDDVLVDLGLGTVDRAALESYRVASWSVKDSAGVQDGTITVNDMITDLLSRLRQRVDRMQSGSVVIGTSTPPSTGDDTLAPAAPTGLAASSIAYQDEANAETYAAVTLGWTAPTTNTDGSALTDLAGYRIRYAYLGLTQVGPVYTGAPEPTLHFYEVTDNQGVTGTSYTFAGVGPGANIRLQVRAFDNNGNQGPWSTGLDITTEVDNTAPGIPSRPTGEDWFGTARVHWDGTDDDGAVMADAFLDFDHIELHRGLSNNFTVVEQGISGSTYLVNLYAAGTWNDADLTYNVGYFYRLVSVDRAGNRSDPSLTSLAITPRQLVSQDLIDDIIDATKLSDNSVQSQHVVAAAITSAKILDAAIVTAKIADLAVNNAKVADLSVGKLTAGTMTADVLLSGIIRTALTGARAEIDSAGLRLYNSAGTNTVNLSAATGSALVTGTYQSGLTGERINILPDGSLRFYPPAGSNYSQMRNEGNDIVFRGPLDANLRSGRVNVNTIGAGMNFSAESELSTLRSEVLVKDRYIQFTSPNQRVQLDGRFSPLVDSERWFDFTETDGSGLPISGTRLRYRNEAAKPCLIAPARNSGFKFDTNAIAVVDNTANAYVNINALAYPGPSSRTIKGDEAPIGLDVEHIVDTVEIKQWRFLQDLERLGDDAPWHYSPIAEDVDAIEPRLVSRGMTVPGLETRDLNGVLMAYVQRLGRRVRELEQERSHG